ncbi:hypothetical protein BGZ80_008261, partial [Entomortierella chlamydospora]
MDPLDLTRKLCWLHGMCAFLRPSDIARIDVSKCIVTDTSVKLKEARPKETSHGIHQNTTHILKRHRSIPALCPMQTFKAYQRRLVGKRLQRPHDTCPSLTYNPLVRAINDPDVAIGADRIRNHIKAIMSKLVLPKGARVPKARAAASAEATKKGVSLDDIITHGNWQSKK